MKWSIQLLEKQLKEDKELLGFTFRNRKNIIARSRCVHLIERIREFKKVIETLKLYVVSRILLKTNYMSKSNLIPKIKSYKGNLLDIDPEQRYYLDIVT